MMDRDIVRNMQFYFKNKFEELVLLVGFIIRIYHVARSSECQIQKVVIIMNLRLSALWPIVPAPGNWWNDDCR